MSDDRLIVGLDLPDATAARAMVASLGDEVRFYKVGLGLVPVGGLELAAELRAAGKRVFLDLKLFDIGATVTAAVRALAGLAPDFLTVHGDPRVASYSDDVVTATEDDWGTEYLSADISVAIVDSLDGALDHIRRYGTGHTEAIVTESTTAARRFAARVDAAAVMVNASTRFTDGGEFGFGAEIGISTQKLHARGPMGLPELTSTKYIVTGNGHTR